MTKQIAPLRRVACLLLAVAALEIGSPACAETFTATITGVRNFTLSGVHAGDTVVLYLQESLQQDGNDVNEGEGVTISYPGGSITMVANAPPAAFARFVAPQDAPIVSVTNYWFDGDEIVTLTANYGTSDPKNAGPACPEVQNCGDPINTGNGNAFQTESDYLGSGPIALRFARFYNSLDVGNGLRPLGYNWTHTYDRWVTVDASGNATVHLPTGKGLTFQRNANGTYTADADVHTTLTGLSNGGWQYRNEDDGEEIYSPAGQLTSVSDRTGYVQVLSYDGSGRLASVADPFGRTLAFTYGANGQIGSFVDPAGRLYTYSYDASNNLTGVTYPDGTSRQYLYESSSLPHALTGLIDENGKRYASWSYASNGMTASSQLANGANAVSVVYHDDGSSTVTNALGVVQANQFGVGYKVPVITSIALQCPVCSGIARAFTYDFYGNRAGETDFAGNATTFAGSDLPYSVVQGANTPEAQTTSYAWEPGYRWLPESIQRGDISTHELYILFFYDARARLLKRYRFVYSNYTWVSHNVWNYSYAPDGVDSNGNALPGPRATASDPLGHATQYTYDAKQNLASIVDPLGNITRFTSYDVDGRPLVMFDPNLVETDLVYDQRGRLTSVTTAGAATLFGYDGAGNLIGITLANGAKFTYGYDDAHRLINVTDNQGNSISYTLDAVGNRTQSDIRDGGGALRYTQARVFDALSRLTTIVGLNGNLTLGYDAASNLTHYQDGRGNATTFAFDALNRVIQAADPLGKTTDYQYDATGVVSGIADPNGHTTAYTRDPQLGTLTTVASPDNGTASYTYDEARNPISRTDGNGGAIQYGYDALNRLTSLQPVNFPSQSIALYYDEPGATNGIGRITRVVDASGNISYNYTPRGRIASETHTVGGNSYTVRYNYDSADQLIGMTYPSGRIVT